MGRRPDGRSDLFSFGVLLFELLTGELPQPGDRPGDLEPSVPALADRIFERCYARREKRFARVEDVLALENEEFGRLKR
jgi:serine/threonine protein kinase